MSRDLDERWASFADAFAASLDPQIMRVAEQAFLFGVVNGICVYRKRIDGEYQ